MCMMVVRCTVLHCNISSGMDTRRELEIMSVSSGGTSGILREHLVLRSRVWLTYRRALSHVHVLPGKTQGPANPPKHMPGLAFHSDRFLCLGQLQKHGRFEGQITCRGLLKKNAFNLEIWVGTDNRINLRHDLSFVQSRASFGVWSREMPTIGVVTLERGAHYADRPRLIQVPDLNVLLKPMTY